MAGGLLKPNDGLEGDIERGALGVNDGLEGVNEGDLLGLNDGLEGVNEGDLLGLNDGPEGAIDGDLPELNGEIEPLEGPGLGLDLIAWRPPLLTTELRSEPPRAAMTLGVTPKMLDE